MDVTSVMIEMLRQKKEITPLEQDILDTWDELLKNPFDSDTAKVQVLKNDSMHPDVRAAIAALPTTERGSLRKVTDGDLRYNLNHQLGFLIAKEAEALNHGK